MMMKSRTSSAKKQKGNQLLFVLLALVIGGVVLAVGVNQYQDAENKASVQETVGQVNTIIGNAKQNFGQYAYAGITTSIAIGSRVIPDSLSTSPTTAVNKFGGAVTFADNGATNAGTGLLTYQNVPAESCVAIVNGTQALARRVIVGTTDVKPLDGTINVATLNAQCTAAANTSIGWVTGRT